MVEHFDLNARSADSKISPDCYISARLKDDNPIVIIKGEIDIDSAAKAYAILWKATESGERNLILDLEQVEFMDSSGLQVLLRLRENLENKKHKVLLVNPQKQLAKLFQLTGFDKLFTFFDEVSQAETYLSD